MMKEDKVVETAVESYDDSETSYIGKKPRSRERGPDKKPRTYKANSMSNLTQFNQRPEEFAKYLKDVKGVDITGNPNLVKILLILGGIGLTGLGGWWLYNHYKKATSKIDTDVRKAV